MRYPMDASHGYAFDFDAARARTTPRTRAILINSPSNPTGSVLGPEDLRAVARLGVRVVSDEIYHELEYGSEPADTILRYTDEAFVIDGFSKRYRMTGWRLGWMVVPPAFVRPIRKVHQNYFLCASMFVQKAGIAALQGPQDSMARVVAEYDRRRRRLVAGLRDLGFRIDYEPSGAFYVLAGAEHLGDDSVAIARRILDEAGVAVTPGVDFGPSASRSLRFSYATAIDRIEEGLGRLARLRP